MMSTCVFVVLLASVLCQSYGARESDDLPLQTNVVIRSRANQTCPSSGLLETERDDVRRLIQDAAFIIKSPEHERVCACGDEAIGWRRVAYLNMTDTDQTCPDDWRLISSPIRTCGRSTNNGCSSASYSSGGITYSRICGRIVGYQFGHTDAFWQYINHNVMIDGAYLDGGVSITHGNPRQHIWSLASGISQNSIGSEGCPCNNGNNYGANLPSWIGEDYFCDSAVPASSADGTFYSDNPLWDGVGCDETLTTCCEFNNPPWFCKQLPQPTVDDIEIRLCGDQDPTVVEDTPIELVEIYIC